MTSHFTALGRLRALVALLMLIVSSSQTAYGAAEDAKLQAQTDKAKAAFGLGHFKEAAEAYEAAFALKPAAALLYNAAQSHRMAGNKGRALDLYQSYLRLYSEGRNRAESEQHVANLTKALEDERRVATAPPNGMAAEVEAEAEPKPAQSPAPLPGPRVPETNETQTSQIMVSQADASHADEPLTSKTWFWVGVGGGVVAVTALVLALTLGGDSAAAAPSDRIAGN